jgi:hypothetical protein
VTVEVVFRDGGEVDGASGGYFVGVVCHAGFHFLGDVDDDGFVPEEKSGFGSGTLRRGRPYSGERRLTFPKTISYLTKSWRSFSLGPLPSQFHPGVTVWIWNERGMGYLMPSGMVISPSIVSSPRRTR